jgi:hypothetical protein
MVNLTRFDALFLTGTIVLLLNLSVRIFGAILYLLGLLLNEYPQLDARLCRLGNLSQHFKCFIQNI